MDYETVSIVNPGVSPTTCWVEFPMCPGWDAGELTEILLTVVGNIIVGDVLISAEDFIKGSNTKYTKMVLKNHLGEEVDVQYAQANKDFEFCRGKASFYYVVDQEVTGKLTPGTYYLYVYLMNTLPKASEEIPERTIMNMALTSPGGIKITIS